MMIFFSALFYKLIPLYANILLGFAGGKWLNIKREMIAKVLFYFMIPIIVFNGVLQTKLDPSILFLPLLVFIICTILSLVVYAVSKKVWNDSTVNLAAFSAGTANAGYFGLPVALLLFDEQGEGVYIMAILGIILFENTIGYYIMAKGKYTPSQAIMKVLQIPALYALFFGLIFNYYGILLPESLEEWAELLKGAYSVLGMMIVGLGLAGLKHFTFDPKFVTVTFIARFIAWPLATILIIAIDAYFFGFFDPTIANALTLISIVPLGANMVLMATLFDSQPEKASAAVMISFIFAMFYVPAMSHFLIRA